MKDFTFEVLDVLDKVNNLSYNQFIKMLLAYEYMNTVEDAALNEDTLAKLDRVYEDWFENDVETTYLNEFLYERLNEELINPALDEEEDPFADFGDEAVINEDDEVEVDSEI